MEHALPSSAPTFIASLPSSTCISFSFSPPSSPPVQSIQNNQLISTTKIKKYRTINTNIYGFTNDKISSTSYNSGIDTLFTSTLEEKNMKNGNKKEINSVEKDIFDQITVREENVN